MQDTEDGVYTGGLDTNETDGEFALMWGNYAHQVVFHVATLMPNLPSDKGFTNKKRHIGNDNVIIIYSDSKTSYHQETISGQFNFVNIIIYPRDPGYYYVEVKKKSDVPECGPLTQPQIISEDALVPLVRQTALNADFASSLLQGKMEYVSNSQERLRQIKQIEKRFAVQETEEDFAGVYFGQTEKS